MADLAVNVNNLTLCYDDFVAVNNISFSVKRGEIFGFLGANGAGKTTTIRVLCGLLRPTAGSVTVSGIEFTNDIEEMAIKKIVGYMSQKFTLYPDLTVEENLSFIASLRSLSPTFYLKRRKFLLDFISFNRSLNSLVKELPGGIKQQVSLIASLLHDPEIIFLDEPTAGVTPRMRVRFWSLIQELVNLKKTVFVTTHYMDEAEQCKRIALMNMGKIIALGTPDELKLAAFPNKIMVFDPRETLEYAGIQALRSLPEFEFFEPYGTRFHAAFNKGMDTNSLEKKLKQKFNIKTTAPTLEDVFIKMIEGGRK